MDFVQIKETLGALTSRLIRLDFAGIVRLKRVNTLFAPHHIHHNFTHMGTLFHATDIPVDTAKPSPLEHAPAPLPDTITHLGQTKTLSDWRTERNISALLAFKDNKVVYEDYAHGTGADDLRMSWSMAKSILSLLLGALIDSGLFSRDIFGQNVAELVPALRGSGYDGASFENVLNMASGVAFNEDYMDYHSDINRMGRILALGGSMDAFAASLGREYEPGTYSHYVSIDTHVIGMVIRAVTGKEIVALIDTFLLGPLGLEKQPVYTTDTLGEPFVLGGLNMTARDFARVGLMVMNGGQWNGHQIISEAWIKASTRQSAPPPSPKKAGTPDGLLGYGYQWWLPPGATKGECFAIGIYGQYIYIDPIRRVVVVMHAGDVNFRDGDGAVCQENLSVFRAIAAAL